MVRLVNFSQRVLILAPLLCLAGCGAMPHDLARRPVGWSQDAAGSSDAAFQLTPDLFLDLWRGFASELADSRRLMRSSAVHFNGSMVVLGPGANAGVVATMSREVAALRRVWSDYYETRYIEVAAAKAAVDAASALQRSLRREVQARPETRVLQLAAASGWWDLQVDRLATAGVVDPEGGFAHAREVFESYCDVKIWELGVSPHMLTGGFPLRPQAFGPCEGYYAAKGYFGGPVCEATRRDQSTRHGDLTAGAWFDCIWQEGILVTEIFQARFTADKRGVIAMMTGEGWLKAALAAADRAADARASVLGMKRARKKTFSRFEGDPMEEALRELFVPDVQPPGVLASTTPRAMLDSVEEQPRSQSQLNPELAFFPRAQNDAAAFAAERDAHGAIAALGKRDFVHFMSVGDFLWNGQSASMPWSEWIDLAEANSWLYPVLSAASPQDSAAMAAARDARNQAQMALKAAQERESAADKEFHAQAARTLAASVANSAVIAFWPEVQLTLEHENRDDDVQGAGSGMTVTLSLSRAVPALKAPVSDAPQQSGFTAWLDRSTGALRLRIPAGELQRQGFGVRLPAPDTVDARTRGFNDIPADFDHTTSFEAALYLSRMGPTGKTPVISGRTSFSAGSMPGVSLQIEGEVSFLRL